MACGGARQQEPAIPGKESLFNQPWKAIWQPSWGPAPAQQARQAGFFMEPGTLLQGSRG